MKKITFVLWLILFGVTIMNAQTDPSVIQVAGKATVKEYPKEIVFRIPLKIIDTAYLGCSERLAKTLNKLQTDLKNKGIAEELIHTDNYSISENIVFEGGKRIQKGFIGSVNFMLKEDFNPEFVDMVLESVKHYKLNYSISFSMSEDQKKGLNSDSDGKCSRRC